MPTTNRRPSIFLPKDTGSSDNAKRFLPIEIIGHKPEDSAADSTSTDKKDVQDESQSIAQIDEPKESKWFDIVVGILVSTVPMVLGGYLLHVLTRENESDLSDASVAESMPKKER